MELESTYKLHDEVRFLQHPDYALVTHLGNGAWFKIVPWAVEILSGLEAVPLGEHIRHVAEAHEQPEDEVRQFFEALGQSRMIEATAPTESPAEQRPDFKLEGVVWRASADALSDTLFSDQAAARFIDTLVMSGVQRVVLEGDWLVRDDISDLVSLAQMVSGLVLLSVNDATVSPETCARLESVPELVEVQTATLHPQEGDPLASTRRALNVLKDNYFHMLRVRVPLRELNAAGLESVFETLDPLEVGLNLSCLLPNDRDALCVAGQLSESSIGSEGVVDLFKKYLTHEVSTFNILSLQWFFDRLLKRTKCTCGAGRHFVTVESDGGLYPCLSLMADETKIGQWTEGKFLGEIIAASPVVETLRRRRVDDIPGCRDCDVRYFCGGGCPANARCAGDILGRDPFCPAYQKLFRAAIAVWQDDRVLEDNFAAMIDVL